MSDFIPNSFQVPNVVIDEYLCKLSANAFKAYMFIVRKTKGWNKSSDGISQSQFMEALGVGSDNTVRKALDELLKLNLILEKKAQGRYSVFFIDVTAQNYSLTSAESADVPPQKVRNTSAESADVPPQKVRTQTNTNQTNTNKLKKSKPKKVKPGESSQSQLDAKSVADYLDEKIRTKNKNAKNKIDSWVEDIEKAIRLDHRTKGQLALLIDWMYSSSKQGMFWRGNVLSGKKLREKFDQMMMQYQTEKGGGLAYGSGNKSSGYAGETEVQRIRRINAESRERNLKHGTKSTDDHF